MQKLHLFALTHSFNGGDAHRMSRQSPAFSYMQFREDDYLRLLRFLIQEKGSARQIEFLEATRDDQHFLDYLLDYLDRVPVDGERELPLWHAAISADKFLALPPEAELSLYRLWADLSPTTASRSGFWAYLTIRHIDAGVIQATHLVASRGQSGEERINQALAGGVAATVDGRVRDILRRMGGLPIARGPRSVYSDCVLGRAWWRERLVEEATSDLAEQVRNTLRTSGRQVWEKLIDRLASKRSPFGPMNRPSKKRGEFVLAFARYLASRPGATVSKDATSLRYVCEQAVKYQADPDAEPLDEKVLALIIAMLESE